MRRVHTANRLPRQAAVLLTACLLFLLLPVSLSAKTVSLAGDKIGLELDDAYTVLTADNLKKEKEFLEKLGHSPQSFKTYMAERDMLMVAASADNTKQVQVKALSTSFSEKVEDLSNLDSDSFEQAANALLLQNAGDQLLSWSKVTRGDLTFLQSTFQVTDKQAAFCYIQYTTIRDGKYYALVYYNFGGEITESQAQEAAAIFQTLRLPEKKRGSVLAGGNLILLMVIVGVLIAAALTVITLLVVSFVKDVQARRREEEQTVHIRIKRRKF
ncbi:MAG: hypothetical protein HFE86_08255 [Clostridiales bacterium]|nr:hypothetical protein [Clostridiales bacterium]